jgi:hypothetical protein
VSRRAFCVATAIALLTARSSTAWAEVEDVGAPGPAILNDASGSSGPSNLGFAFRDPSVGSTFLSVRGNFVPIVRAGLEPSEEGLVDPGQPATAFDYNVSQDYYSGAPAIPATVKDFGAADADAIIQNDFMLNGAGDSMITDPAGATWATIYGSSSPLALSAGTVNPRTLKASCSGDGSGGAVIRCVVLEDRIALGLPTDGGTGAQAGYQSGQQDFGSESLASPGFGAPTGPLVKATLSTAPIYFSVANEATLPAVYYDSTPVFDLGSPSGTSTGDPIVNPPSVGIGYVPQSPAAPSVPELPAPTMIVIGLGGIALARRFRLRSAARLV